MSGYDYEPIAGQKGHRVRLRDVERDLIIASLAARLAMTRGKRRELLLRLIVRLRDGDAGNPNFKY